MADRLRWGILGTARHAQSSMIGPINAGSHGVVRAIASRSLDKAQDVARRLGIPKAYGSYEALLSDPEIDAVYNPLPNHLHVPVSLQAMEAGKHVLCEKPIAMSAAEASTLIDAQRRTGRQVMECFMVRFHPQWLKVVDLVQSGRIGVVQAIHGYFAYFNDDPDNIRNKADIGGGGLYDIGVYPVTTSRLVMAAEPSRVSATLVRDPTFGTDRMAAAILDFDGVPATFSCSTRSAPAQRMQLFGTRGSITVEIPFNAPTDRPTRLVVDDARDLFGSGQEVIEIPTVNQYTLMADAFAAAIQQGLPVPLPITDGVANMAVIDALFRAADSGRWEPVRMP